MMIKYFGFFKNGVHVAKGTIKEFSTLQDITYILRKEFYNQYTAVTNTYYQYKYTSVDSKDEQKNIKVGYFELIDIGVDNTNYRGVTREILIKNNNTGEVHKIYDYSISEGDLLFKSILPLMQRLHELGSYEMYHKMKEFEAMEYNIEEVRTENKELKKRILELEKADIK